MALCFISTPLLLTFKVNNCFPTIITQYSLNNFELLCLGEIGAVPSLWRSGFARSTETPVEVFQKHRRCFRKSWVLIAICSWRFNLIGFLSKSFALTLLCVSACYSSYFRTKAGIILNPFTPESDQFQISPPEILHHTYEELGLALLTQIKDYYTINSHYLTYNFSYGFAVGASDFIYFRTSSNYLNAKLLTACDLLVNDSKPLREQSFKTSGNLLGFSSVYLTSIVGGTLWPTNAYFIQCYCHY